MRKTSARAAPSSSLSELVPRVSLTEFLSSPVYDAPILIYGILQHQDQVESLSQSLMELLGDQHVSLQRKMQSKATTTTAAADDSKTTTTTEIYNVTLNDTIDYLMESSHEDAFFAFCEDLLPLPCLLSDNSVDSKDPLSQLSKQLAQIREAPFRGDAAENWFDYFPPSIRPGDAVILAGEGATSTLHRDPFEWTGTSFCIEGTKIWRFLVPPSPSDENKSGVEQVDEALQSYRLDSVAWENTNDNDNELRIDRNATTKPPLVLSAGWQSDMTLFETRREDTLTAMELAQLEDQDEEAFKVELETMGRDPTSLRPSSDAEQALRGVSSEDQHSDGPTSTTAPSFVTAIQGAGGLLVIPAHYWHMTYAPVPSIAIASQRCCAAVDGANVVGHILDVAFSERNGRSRPKGEIPKMLEEKYYDPGNGKNVVDALFHFLNT